MLINKQCTNCYRRSHCFRELLIADMQLIFELTTETNPEKPLPPPRPTALNLKQLSLKTIREWNDLYGKGYKKLALGYNYLRQCKKVSILNVMHFFKSLKKSLIIIGSIYKCYSISIFHSDSIQVPHKIFMVL